MTLTLLLILSAAAVILACRRERGGAHLYPPRRGLATRLACATVALACLSGIACGTWRSMVHQLGHDGSGGTHMHHLTLEQPALSDTTPPARARVLVQMAVVRRREVLASQEFILRLPEDANHQFSWHGEVARARFGVDCTPKQVVTSADHRSTCDGYFSMRLSSENSHTECGGFPALDGKPEQESCPMGIGGAWSLFHGTHDRDLELLARAQLVAANDPLRFASASEIARELEDGQADQVAAAGATREQGPPALDYLSSCGPAGLIALLAAMLLAQLYRRRALAFAGCLALCMLFCATLDRAVVARSAAVADDASVPPDARALALDALGGTFFFRQEAIHTALVECGDARAPEEVHAAAVATVSMLRAVVASFGLQDNAAGQDF